MTYTPTHLGISTLLMYSIMPKRRKQYLKNNPIIFFFLSLGALIPDLDLLFGGHRFISHSIFIPLIFTLISRYVKHERYENLSFNLQFLGIIWFSHIVFDLSFGPLALFWPIDDRFYDVVLGVVFNLEGNILLPITITGLFMAVIMTDPLVGTQTFFVNWTIEERLTYYGSSILKWPIENFMVHTLISLWWVYFIVFPFMREIYRKWKQKRKVQDDKKQSSLFAYAGQFIAKIRKLKGKRNDWSVLVLLLVLIYASLYAGPFAGKSWEYEKTESEILYTLSDTFRVAGSKNFTLPPNSDLYINISVPSSTITFSLFIIKLQEVDIESILDEISNKTDMLDAGKLTKSEFFDEYKSIISTINIEEKVVNENNSASWEFFSNYNITLLFGLASWNTSQSFVRSISIGSIWTIQRDDQFRNGVIAASFFSSMFVSILLRGYFKRNKSGLD